jgi:tetratricopeptide (TPR) repeat protein
MAFLAQCAPERIPMTLVEGAIDDEVERVQALAALSEVSLVKHDPFEDGPPAVTVHRLVQAVARSRAEAKGIASDAFSGLLKKLVELYPEDGRDDPEGRTLQEMLTPHVIACSRIKITDPSANEKLAKIVLSAADYLSGSALYAEARSLYQRAITLSENLFGPEHPRIASGLYGLGGLLWKQNELNQARALLERALAIREAVLGSDHPDTAKSLDTLGGLLRLQDEPEKARVLLARGLAIRERVLGAEHPETADSLRSMGVLLLAQNDPQARPSFERSLARDGRAHLLAQ